MRKIKTLEEKRWLVGPANAQGQRVSWPQVRKAIVYYHADWTEYWVRFFIDDQHLRKADYPADSKEDAIASADFFVNRELNRGE